MVGGMVIVFGVVVDDVLLFFDLDEDNDCGYCCLDLDFCFF